MYAACRHRSVKQWLLRHDRERVALSDVGGDCVRLIGLAQSIDKRASLTGRHRSQPGVSGGPSPYFLWEPDPKHATSLGPRHVGQCANRPFGKRWVSICAHISDCMHMRSGRKHLRRFASVGWPRGMAVSNGRWKGVVLIVSASGGLEIACALSCMRMQHVDRSRTSSPEDLLMCGPRAQV